jgi:hypothetical protein
MDPFVSDLPNGATWIRDCLLGNPEIAKARDRLHENSPKGIRHFSSNGKAVPLEQAESTQIELSRLEKQEERELRAGMSRL